MARGLESAFCYQKVAGSIFLVYNVEIPLGTLLYPKLFLMLVGTLHVSHCHQCMNVSIKHCEPFCIKVSAKMPLNVKCSIKSDCKGGGRG